MPSPTEEVLPYLELRRPPRLFPLPLHFLLGLGLAGLNSVLKVDATSKGIRGSEWRYEVEGENCAVKCHPVE